MIRTIAHSSSLSGPESEPQRAIHRIFNEGLLVVTDRRQAVGTLVDTVKAVLDAGARVVLLREKDLPREQRLELALQLRELGAYVIAAGPDPLGGDAVHLSATDQLGGDAVHLSATDRLGGDAADLSATDRLGGDAVRLSATDRLGGDAVRLSATDRLNAPRAVASACAASQAIVGRSCHSAAEVAALSDEDYCTLSPIFPSPSKPGYGPALGPVFPAGKPVYALGGIDSADKARACRDAGAAGVAVMGAIMRNPALTKEFLR